MPEADAATRILEAMSTTTGRNRRWMLHDVLSRYALRQQRFTCTHPATGLMLISCVDQLGLRLAIGVHFLLQLAID